MSGKMGAKELLSAVQSENGLRKYLNKGGSCLELLQVMETDSTIPPHLVFSCFTQLLLEISSTGEFFNSAYEACRYLLNNYLPVIHKMLGLSSKAEERKACLKLLTAMATLSPKLARDVLINVKFHSASVELLTKHTFEKQSVRSCFIQFLTALLIDGDSFTLVLLLERSGLLTSIISGLQYDEADTVCIIIAAMKNHILQSPMIKKTTKMHVFNTGVVKTIVNLYNWKGPQGLNALEKTSKTTMIEVDKVKKSKVNECIHDFLLILCASHKYGVIFKDPLMGLGRKHVNSLMYTVLESLERPWTHSYASELLIEICKACPDLTKNLWTIVSPFLEPRLTENWLSAMEFSRKLIDTIDPDCMDYCIENLLPHQISTIMQILVSPLPVLKILLVEIRVEQSDSIKGHILRLLKHMLVKLSHFLAATKTKVSDESFTKIGHNVTNYIAKHYPNANKLLEEFRVTLTTENEQVENLLDILSRYRTMAPQLLYNLSSSHLDIKYFLNIVQDGTLRVKLLSIFVDIDRSQISPGTDIFQIVFPVLLKSYREERNSNAKTTLYKILENSGIFEGSRFEISIWLNGIFNVKKLSDVFVSDLARMVQSTLVNLTDSRVEQLSEGSEIEHRKFSAMLVGSLKFCQEHPTSKYINKYMEFVLYQVFHNQSDPQNFLTLVRKYVSDVVPATIISYFDCWTLEGAPVALSQTSGAALSTFEEIAKHFLNGRIDQSMFEIDNYPDVLQDCLSMATFYFANLAAKKELRENHAKNWLVMARYVVGKHADYPLDFLLRNARIVQYFSVKSLFKSASTSRLLTRTVLELIGDFKKDRVDIDKYVHIYANSIFSAIVKVVQSAIKRPHLKDIVTVLNMVPLNYQQTTIVLHEVCSILDTLQEIDEGLLALLVHCLGHFTGLCKSASGSKPLETSQVSAIAAFLARLNRLNYNASALCDCLKHYFEVFPENASVVDKDLFSSLLVFAEYRKEHADLAVFLLEHNLDELLVEVERDLASICEKKGLILPILHVLLTNGAPETVLKAVYDRLEPAILKALQKPQKASQHFAKSDSGLPLLVSRFMSQEQCRSFANKVQKFESSQVFHAKLLEAVFSKAGSSLDEKQAANVIMTFVHLIVARFKRIINAEEDFFDDDNLCRIFCDLLDRLRAHQKITAVTFNETVLTFCKSMLKFGVPGREVLLENLRKFTSVMRPTKDEARLLWEMLWSHSEFLNVVLGEHKAIKLEVLRLIYELGDAWNELMAKNQVAILLAGYRATMADCDRVTRKLLELYESKREQTGFMDFRPFLWGRAAAGHYSVRAQIQNALDRQPKTSDVLALLKADLVASTIGHYPLKFIEDPVDFPEAKRCYDLKFMLTVFSHISAPEQLLKTHVFIKSGALSLTILGLACEEKEIRLTAVNVLSRLHFHLEAKQTNNKHLVVWFRFIESLCAGLAQIPDMKMNNFAAIFFARTALVLTDSKHVMYAPLSLYLALKERLDLQTVPELYALFFSSDVNHREHRIFVLEVIRDGMKTEKDFLDFWKSMAFKLCSELLNSHVVDSESRTLILQVFERICKIPLGVRVLIENFALLPQLSGLASSFSGSPATLNLIKKILSNIEKVRSDEHVGQFVGLIN